MKYSNEYLEAYSVYISKKLKAEHQENAMLRDRIASLESQIRKQEASEEKKQRSVELLNAEREARKELIWQAQQERIRDQKKEIKRLKGCVSDLTIKIYKLENPEQ